MYDNNERYTVDAIIEDDSYVVLIERGVAPDAGKLALPGGHIEPGEHPVDALSREVYEETHLPIKVDDELGNWAHLLTPYGDDDRTGTNLVYRCTPQDDTLHAGGDATAADWYDLTDIPDDLAFDHHRLLEHYRTHHLRDQYERTIHE